MKSGYLIPERQTLDLPSAKNPKKTVRKTVTKMVPRYWKDAKHQEPMLSRDRLDEAHALTVKNGGRQFYVRDRTLGTGDPPAATEASVIGEGAKNGTA